MHHSTVNTHADCRYPSKWKRLRPGSIQYNNQIHTFRLNQLQLFVLVFDKRSLRMRQQRSYRIETGSRKCY